MLDQRLRIFARTILAAQSVTAGVLGFDLSAVHEERSAGAGADTLVFFRLSHYQTLFAVKYDYILAKTVHHKILFHISRKPLEVESFYLI